MTFFLRVVCSLFFWLSIGGLAAEPGAPTAGSKLTFLWENDAIEGTDRHYTQGASLTYWSRDGALPRWLKQLSDVIPVVGYSSRAQKFGVGIGQEIYTPADLDTATVLPDDRPYAGWLYLTGSLQRRGPAFGGIAVLETVRVDFGIIGPQSLAEDAQKEWHGRAPQGWIHQLKSEPGLVIRYDRRFLYEILKSDAPWNLQIIPGLNASLGNVSTHAGITLMARAGYHIPNEFASGSESRPSPLGIYTFIGIEGRGWARNIFLDGNTFHAGHHVTKLPWTGEWRYGLGVTFRRVEMSVAQVIRGREFRMQKTDDSFATATLSFRF